MRLAFIFSNRLSVGPGAGGPAGLAPSRAAARAPHRVLGVRLLSARGDWRGRFSGWRSWARPSPRWCGWCGLPPLLPYLAGAALLTYFLYTGFATRSLHQESRQVEAGPGPGQPGRGPGPAGHDRGPGNGAIGTGRDPAGGHRNRGGEPGATGWCPPCFSPCCWACPDCSCIRRPTPWTAWWATRITATASSARWRPGPTTSSTSCRPA